jgi:hypothetical protein
MANSDLGGGVIKPLGAFALLLLCLPSLGFPQQSAPLAQDAMKPLALSSPPMGIAEGLIKFSASLKTLELEPWERMLRRSADMV